MKFPLVRHAIGAVASVLLVLLAACQAEPALPDADPALVSAYTAGRIPADSTILVEFTRDVAADVPLGPGAVLRFDPPLVGVASWETPRLLSFKPVAPLQRGITYRAFCDSKALTTAMPGIKDFGFRFRAVDQALSSQAGSLQLDGSDTAMVEFAFSTQDKVDVAKLEAAVRLEPANDQVQFAWTHEPDSRQHRLTVSRLPRKEQESVWNLVWDGSSIGAAQSGRHEIKVPGAQDFGMLSARPVSGAEEYIEVSFSDMVDRDQDLRGLIVAEDSAELGYVIKGNLVRVYRADGWKRESQLLVRSGIRNRQQQRLVKDNNVKVTFPSKIPEVRFVGSGVILPTTRGQVLPIETMNLKAVMVEVLQIHQDNVSQFLQVNTLDGERELNRVGTVVWRDVVKLDWKDSDTDRWVRHGLNLEPLQKQFSGGMFRLRLSFRHPHIQWQCDSSDAGDVEWDKEAGPEADQQEAAESSYWDGAEGYYNYGDYDYSRRLDPCAKEFYMKLGDHDINKSRNVLVSDLGIIARRSMDGKLGVALSDLRTGEPLANVGVDLYSYQRQSLAKVTTDANGFASFGPESGKAFLVAASARGQYGYVRLLDGESLAVSHFDVAGERVENGVNGLIYGERGVWRPGNPMHLVFLLNDPRRSLPENHPVVMNLIDPQGQVRSTKTLNKGLNGFYYFDMETAEDDPTGNWQAEVILGNRRFNKTLKVETIVPNRLKIDMRTEGPDPEFPSVIEGTLHAEWLHGAPSPNLRADITAYLEAGKTTFGGEYGDYIFDDVSRRLSFEPVTIFDDTLDGSGNAKFISKNLNVGDTAPGKLRLTMATRVYEDEGAFSSDVYTTDYHPYPAYVGLVLPKGDAARDMLLTDVDHPVRIAMLKPDGSKVASGNVTLEVYQARWRWWWESSSDNNGDYREEEHYSLISKTDGKIVNGQATVNFRINYPSWGRYLVKVVDKNGGHAASRYVYVDWPGWAGRPSKDSPGGASMLLLAAAKPAVTVGEDIVVAIPGNDKARALVAIEAGGSIIKQEWVALKGKSTEYRIKATGAMAPNIYVHVTLLQPHAQTANDLPIRMYGVIPVLVEDPASRLNPVIVCDNEWKPQSTIKVKVSEQQGKGMSYTLAIVDEGLLGLTRYRAPNPWDTFFKRQASLVKTWDLYKYVMGAYSGNLDSLLAIGGADDAAMSGKKKADRYPPVVLFEVPRTLAKGATNEHTLTLPPYMGAVRVMVVAAQDGAYGRAEKSVPVRNVLMAQMTAPRVLSPGEDIRVPVTVFYTGPVPQTVTVSLKPSGPVDRQGPENQTVQFTAAGEKVVYYPLRTRNTTGSAELTMLAQDRAGNRMEENIVFTVRQVNLPETRVMEGTIAASGKFQTNLASLMGMAGTNTLTLELSTVPPIDLGRRLDFLIQYPHGCLEQTTSSVFPQLYLPDVLELEESRVQAIKNNVAMGVERLKTFLLPEGNFSYWPGANEVNDWASIYAGHFLVEAKRGGYDVPETMLGPWTSRQKQLALSWRKGKDSVMIQAYRLYVLAWNNEFLMGPLNVLREQKLDPAPLWLVAAALHRGGQADIARKLVQGDSVQLKSYRELSETFGSDFRDKAIIVDAMVQMGLEARALNQARELSAGLSGKNWLSTQETAMGLMAMSRYAKVGYKSGNLIRVNGKLAGKAMDAISSNRAFWNREFVLDSANPGLDLSNAGTVPVFVRAMVRGIPMVGNEQALSQGLRLKIWYISEDKKTLRTFDSSQTSVSAPANVAEAMRQPAQIIAPVYQGTEITVVVSIANTSTVDYKQLALSHLFPAGLELANERLIGVTDSSGKAIDYQDIRDDRILSYFSLPKGQTRTITYKATAAYVGRYRLPMVRVEAMYDGSIQAQIPGQWFDVLPAPGRDR